MPEDHHWIDVSGVHPAAGPIVERIARVFIEHLGTSLVTLVAHGSAVKGGIIWGSSDVDAVAFVRPQRLTAHGELPFEQAVAVHRDLARIDPAPFRYLQAYVSPAQPAGTTGRPGFIPETFQIVTGAPDVPIATSAELMAAARHALGELDPDAARAGISNALLNHGEGRLHRQVRWTCTDIWPLVYHVACVHLDDGLAAWQLTKHEVLAILAGDPVLEEPLAHWFRIVTDHYAHGETLESALATLAAGVAFQEAAARWFSQRQ